MRRLVLFCLVSLASCGAGPGTTIAADIDFGRQFLHDGDLLVFTVLRNSDQAGGPVDCTVVNAGCIADQQGTLQLVPMKVDGSEATRLEVLFDEVAAAGDGQSIELQGVEPSRGLPYHLVVEIERLGQREGHGCALNVTVNRGRNETETITITQTPTACDPTPM